MLCCRPAGEKHSWWAEVWSFVKWYFWWDDSGLEGEYVGELVNINNPKDPGFVLCQRGQRNYMCPKTVGNKTMTQVSPAFVDNMIKSGYRYISRDRDFLAKYACSEVCKPREMCYTKGVGKETGSDSLKGSEMRYDDKSNVRLDEFNKVMMDFVLAYGCQLSVTTTDDGPSHYRLSQKDKWAVLFIVHPSGLVLDVNYNLSADACNYNVLYDIKKSDCTFGIGNYEYLINKLKTLMTTNFIYPVNE